MKKVVEMIRCIEKYFLTALVAGISLFSIGQILLRRFWRVPLWMDSCINYLVVWLAFIAAGIVTYEASHIKIDIIGRFVKGIKKKLVYGFISLFGSLVSAFFMILFLVYIVVIEYFSKVPTMGLSALFHALLLIVIPWGFLVMTIRMINMMCADLYDFTIRINKKSSIQFFHIAFSSITFVFLSVISIFFLKQSKFICLILSLSASVIMLAYILLCFFYSQKQWFCRILSIISGGLLFSITLMLLLDIIKLNCDAKIARTLLDLTDAQLNKMYITPTVCFFFSWLSMIIPFSAGLRAVYPDVCEDENEEAAQ